MKRQTILKIILFLLVTLFLTLIIPADIFAKTLKDDIFSQQAMIGSYFSTDKKPTIQELTPFTINGLINTNVGTREYDFTGYNLNTLNKFLIKNKIKAQLKNLITIKDKGTAIDLVSKSIGVNKISVYKNFDWYRNPWEKYIEKKSDFKKRKEAISEIVNLLYDKKNMPSKNPYILYRDYVDNKISRKRFEEKAFYINKTLKTIEYSSDPFNSQLAILRKAKSLNKNNEIEHMSQISQGGYSEFDKDFAKRIKKANEGISTEGSNIRNILASYIITQNNYNFPQEINSALAGLKDRKSANAKDLLLNELSTIYNTEGVYSNKDLQLIEGELNKFSKDQDNDNRIKQLDKLIDYVENEIGAKSLKGRSILLQNNIVAQIKNEDLKKLIASVTKDMKINTIKVTKDIYSILEDGENLKEIPKINHNKSRVGDYFNFFNDLDNFPIYLINKATNYINEIKDNFNQDGLQSDYKLLQLKKEEIIKLIEQKGKYNYRNTNRKIEFSNRAIGKMNSKIFNNNNKKIDLLKKFLENRKENGNLPKNISNKGFYSNDFLQEIKSRKQSSNHNLKSSISLINDFLNQSYRSSPSEYAKKIAQLNNDKDFKINEFKNIFNSSSQSRLKVTNTLINQLPIKEYRKMQFNKINKHHSVLKNNLPPKIKEIKNYLILYEQQVNESDINWFINELEQLEREYLDIYKQMLYKLNDLHCLYLSEHRTYKRIEKFIFKRLELVNQKNYFQSIYEGLKYNRQVDINSQERFEEVAKEIYQYKIILKIIKNRKLNWDLYYYKTKPFETISYDDNYNVDEKTIDRKLTRIKNKDINNWKKELKNLSKLKKEIIKESEEIKYILGEDYDDLLYRFFHLNLKETQGLNFNQVEGKTINLANLDFMNYNNKSSNEELDFGSIRQELANEIDYEKEFEELTEHQKYLIPPTTEKEKIEYYKNMKKRMLNQACIYANEIEMFNELSDFYKKYDEYNYFELKDSERIAKRINEMLPFVPMDKQQLRKYNRENKNTFISKDEKMIDNYLKNTNINNPNSVHRSDTKLQTPFVSYKGHIMTFKDIYIDKLLTSNDNKDNISKEKMKQKLLNDVKVETNIKTKMLTYAFDKKKLENFNVYFKIYDKSFENKLNEMQNHSDRKINFLEQMLFD